MSKNIIEVDAKLYNKCKVVTLPTEKATKVFKCHDDYLQFDLDKGSYYAKDYIQYQHLYILSDEEIKEGDWMYIKEPHPKGQIRKCWQIYLWSAEYNEDKIDQLMIDDPKDPKRGYGFCKRNEVYKIIATTDLLVEKDNGGPAHEDDYLPRPPDAFLKSYCEKGGTNEVLVEYERVKKTGPLGLDYFDPMDFQLKVASDNTITIKPIKDSWNREEIKNIIKEIAPFIRRESSEQQYNKIINKWIEENL